MAWYGVSHSTDMRALVLRAERPPGDLTAWRGAGDALSLVHLTACSGFVALVSEFLLYKVILALCDRDLCDASLVMLCYADENEGCKERREDDGIRTRLP